MKVLLIGNYEQDQQESMLRFAQALVQNLPTQGVQGELIRPRCFAGALARNHRALGKWMGYLDKFVIFPQDLKQALRSIRNGASLVHICDHSNAPYTQYLQSVPHLVTCHDLLAVRSALGEFPENPTRWTGRHLQRMILRGLNRARRIACDSQATRDDLLRLSSVGSQRVSIAHIGLNSPFSPMPGDEARAHLRKFLTPDFAPGAQLRQSVFFYVLHVGGNQWYKNRMGVLEIYARLCEQSQGNPPKLIMAGKPFTSAMTRFALEKGLSGKVISVENCSHEELRALYSLAQLLLFPSLAEGFGWPIIEAQACGCRVVASGKPPLTEVAGDSAVYIDPARTAEAAGAVKQLLDEDEVDKQKRIKAGFRNATKFSTEKMIERYVQIYRGLLSDDSNPRSGVQLA